MSAVGRFRFILIVIQYVWCIINCNRLSSKENDVYGNEIVTLDNAEIVKFSDVASIDNNYNYSGLLFTNYRKNYDLNCVQDEDCRGRKEICVENICRCQKYYEYNGARKCVLCPGLGAHCIACCGHGSLACSRNVCACLDEICQGPQGVFITASQIALSAALMMGFAALAMVVYRLCTKPRYLTARHRAAQRAMENFSAGQNSFFRASLSSIQIRVLSRLRDRPPTYENQSGMRQEAIRQPSAAPVQPTEPPPPYEGRRISDIDLPPPYSELILAPGGFINPAYIDTERNVSRLNDDHQPKLVTENSAK